jgi:hypothetical protein
MKIWLSYKMSQTRFLCRSVCSTHSHVEPLNLVLERFDSSHSPFRDCICKCTEVERSSIAEGNSGVGKVLLRRFALVAVEDLLSRSWFGRLWIWQEIHLATSATVFCGPRSIPWNAVRTSVVWLNWLFMNIGTVPLASLRESIQSPLDLCTYNDKNSLEQLMYQMRFCKCSDERDLIFALLSLDPGHPSIDIQPDYTKNCR